MLHTTLELGPGTSDQCRKAVERLPAGQLHMAYKNARFSCNTSDIVLWMSDQSPDIAGGPRSEFKKHLYQLYGRRAAEFGLWGTSAQALMKLPEENDAMWLVIESPHLDLPIMCVLYTIQYETEPAN